MLFGLTNPPATFQREPNRIHSPIMGIKVVTYSEIHLDEDDRLAVTTHMDSIIIATKGSIGQHQNKVETVFD